jgi:DNA-binding PadR family transcriptional regulator
MHASYALTAEQFPGFHPGARHGGKGRCGHGVRHMAGHRRGRWGGPGGGMGMGPGGPRARRGDVRAAILALLAEEPRNGYQIIQELAERTQGLWKPSPGAVYPALSQLEDEGLARAQEIDGKRAFALTDEGQAHVADNAETIGKPWEKVTEGAGESEMALREHIPQLLQAVMMVAKTGSPEQVDEVKKILTETRRAVYRVLAGD